MTRGELIVERKGDCVTVTTDNGFVLTLLLDQARLLSTQLVEECDKLT